MFELAPQLDKDCIFVADLPLCRVLLLNDSQFPWLILVPRVENIKEVIDLDEEQQQIMWQESAVVSRILQRLYNGDKLNIAALGNMVPQLHVHHIVRYKHDPVWPKPVWGQLPAIPYTPDALRDRLTQLQQMLNS